MRRPAASREIQRRNTNGKFIVKTTNTGIKFDYLGADGQVLVTSEVYTAVNACLHGVDSVRKICAGGIEDQTVAGFEQLTHPKFEVYVDQGGKFRFRLKAVNGQIVASSNPFADKAACLAAVKEVKDTAPEAKIVNETA